MQPRLMCETIQPVPYGRCLTQLFAGLGTGSQATARMLAAALSTGCPTQPTPYCGFCCETISINPVAARIIRMHRLRFCLKNKSACPTQRSVSMRGKKCT